MSALTITPDGGSPVVVPVRPGGWQVEAEDTQIVQRWFDESMGSLTINGTATGRNTYRIETSIVTEAQRDSLLSASTGTSTVTLDGDLLAASVVCRTEDIGWDIEQVEDAYRMSLTAREVGS